MNIIKDTLINSTPVIETGHKHDTSYSLLPLGEWIVETLRQDLPEWDANLKGAARAAQTRSIKSDVGIFKLDKDVWKEVTAHYASIRKDYEKANRALVRSLDLKSARHWNSGKVTVSFDPDAVQLAKAEAFTAPKAKEEK